MKLAIWIVVIVSVVVAMFMLYDPSGYNHPLAG